MAYELRYLFAGPEEDPEYILNDEEFLVPHEETNQLPSNARSLLFYEKEDYGNLERAQFQKGYVIESISKLISQPLEIVAFKSSSVIVDLSCITEYSRFQSVAEDVIYKLDSNTIYICDQAKQERLEYELRFVFNEFKGIQHSLLATDEANVLAIKDNETLNVAKNHRKITDLNDIELTSFFSEFRQMLYGHPKFKDDFEEQVRTFQVFNRLGEHKILSIFLMGDSGVGKTEVARAIFSCLKGTKRLAKINFGNYSNEFSLSSLIGSARGYIGSDDGEIFMKVRDTDIGVLLIDEFEKSNATLFNYFLDVLESGKMTSSLGHEIDLNGFIIVFTSNISKEDYKKRISPELRSRFDYKCMFTLLDNEDKIKFLEFRANSIAKRINRDAGDRLGADFSQYLKSAIDVSRYQNMRDINKQIKKIFVEYLASL